MKSRLKNYFIEFMLLLSRIIKYRGVPVLLYHRVLDEPSGSPVYAISLSAFEEQMSYLYREGYRTISCSELIKYVKGEISLPPKSFVITFDDGFQDNYEAVKIAGRYGFNSVLFISTEFIGREYSYVPFLGECSKEKFDIRKALKGKFSFLTAEQLKELKESGAEIYPHTTNHRDLSSASYQEQAGEIMDSDKKLRNMLGSGSEIFCYPYGKYNETTVKILDSLGYLGAFAVKDGLNRKGDDVFSLKRHNASDYSIGYFKLLLTGQFAWYHRIGRIGRSLKRYI